MDVRIDASWKARLEGEFAAPYWERLAAFVKAEYAAGPCFPPGKYIFRAFDLTPFEQVKVVILGQDPYHTPGAAMGLCFSVPEGHPAQPSLQNIFRELATDVEVARTRTDLSDWAQQGVFLLNSVLTVRAGAAGPHAAKGWEKLTDSAIRHLSAEREHLVFILWGGHAQAKRSLIDPGKHLVLAAPHPSPLSASKGFFGSKPFSQAKVYLQAHGQAALVWGDG